MMALNDPLISSNDIEGASFTNSDGVTTYWQPGRGGGGGEGNPEYVATEDTNTNNGNDASRGYRHYNPHRLLEAWVWMATLFNIGACAMLILEEDEYQRHHGDDDSIHVPDEPFICLIFVNAIFLIVAYLCKNYAWIKVHSILTAVTICVFLPTLLVGTVGFVGLFIVLGVMAMFVFILYVMFGPEINGPSRSCCSCGRGGCFRTAAHDPNP